MELGQAVGAAVVGHNQQKSLLSTESEVKQQIPEVLNVCSVTIPTSISS